MKTEKLLSGKMYRSGNVNLVNSSSIDFFISLLFWYTYYDGISQSSWAAATSASFHFDDVSATTAFSSFSHKNMKVTRNDGKECIFMLDASSSKSIINTGIAHLA